MKKYILLLSIYSLSLCAMESESDSDEKMIVENYCDEVALNDRADYCAEKVRNIIDKEDLQVNPEGRFKSLIGYYYSWQKTSSWADLAAVLQQANEIELKINSVEKEYNFFNQRELILDKLMGKHHLVYWVVDKLIDACVRNLNNVTGKNIDDVYQKNDFAVSESLQSFIQKQAIARYSSSNRIDETINNMPFNKKENEIHYTILCGHQAVSIRENRLKMSSEGNFLRTFHLDGTKTIWDMEKGEQITKLTEIKGMWGEMWERNYDNVVVDRHRNYMAMDGMGCGCSVGTNDILSRIQATNPSHPVIALFKRPTLESTLCLNAFLNSKGNKEALLGLQGSQLMKKITGFPGTKLHALIDAELGKTQPELQKIVVN